MTTREIIRVTLLKKTREVKIIEAIPIVTSVGWGRRISVAAKIVRVRAYIKTLPIIRQNA